MRTRKRTNSAFTFKIEDVDNNLTDIGSLFDTSYTSSYNQQLSLFDMDGDKSNEPTATTPLSLISITEEPPKKVKPLLKNYIIKNINIGEGTPLERFNNNIAAIKLLKKLERHNETPTTEQQDILANYVGWGGLAQYFKKESSENDVLLEILTEKEYSDAKESVLSAYYTPPVVINSIWQYIKDCGFTGGNVLEPSCGIGNFFGMMPKDLIATTNLYGVELDSISGRIAKMLYPNANIKINGFEKEEMSDNFFDVAIGNVPYGNYEVPDANCEMNLKIHDYFFFKSLKKVRPGGLICFLTAKGTLDKKSGKFRTYLSQRADLLGAIRLPNNTFKSAAGTEVVSDILIFKKRESVGYNEPLWTKTDLFDEEKGIVINSYFKTYPGMVCGELATTSTQFGGKYGLTVNFPTELNFDAELAHCFDGVVRTDLKDCSYDEDALSEGEVKERITVPADEEVKNFTYTIYDGDVYYRENSVMYKTELKKATEQRIRGLIKIRDLVYDNISIQQFGNYGQLPDNQSELNIEYECYVKKHGRINSRGNQQAFKNDISLPLLNSLEVLDEDGEFLRKADIFKEITIQPKKTITKADNSIDALGISLAVKGEIDFGYMSVLTGKSKDTLIDELKVNIFANPERPDGNGNYAYETADEYLSGNIRKKLDIAKEMASKDERFLVNVSELEKALPAPLEASEIDVKLGAVWIPLRYYNEFIYDLLKIPDYYRKPSNETKSKVRNSYYYKTYVEVEYSKFNSTYNIAMKNSMNHLQSVTKEFGTDRKGALTIIESSLNLQKIKVYDYETNEEGKTKPVLNQEETEKAQAKQEIIEARFKEFIFADYDRRKNLVDMYNEKYNSIVPRHYDGSYLTFDGINPNVELYGYQKDAIAHSLYGGNVLLAHAVGAGKSYEMIASIMEGKRLGKCSKALIVVPNHLTKQMGAEFLTLYPGANILVAGNKDFTKKKRRELISKISTSNFDAVIIGHSQLTKIKLSDDRIKFYLTREISKLELALYEAKENSENSRSFSIRQIEEQKKKLKAKLDNIEERVANKSDSLLVFEQLGIDKLVIDEAHYFKNCSIQTKLSGVAGVSTTTADKSLDLLMKTRYINELTDYSGLIFATGTPVSNSMTEIFTMQNYLQPDALEELGFEYFDAWAAHFGEITTSFELAPEGKGFRMRERFAKFHNIPELMRVFKEVADIKTSDDLNIDVPKCQVNDVSVDPTDFQKDYVQSLSERATEIHSGNVDPSEDNMLKITNDGRKLGLDQRLINPLVKDDESSKVNICVNNVFDLWERYSLDRATQVVFCDLSTPKQKHIEGEFTNVYDDIKYKLIDKGIPADEIAYIHDYKTDIAKAKLFANVRSGKIRVLLGSTNKLGVGTNIQNRLIACHDLDIPWRPSDLEQRLGRMVRQGNMYDKVFLYRYTTKGTFDAYLFQILESKQRFISQIMTSKNPVRDCDNIDDATLDFAEVKALCTGNPHIKEKLELDVEVKKLKILKSSFKQTKFRLEEEINSTLPTEISNLKRKKSRIELDIEDIKNNYPHLLTDKTSGDKEEVLEAFWADRNAENDDNEKDKSNIKDFEIIINGITYTERPKAAEAFKKAISNIEYCDLKSYEYNYIGSYAGMDISIFYNSIYSTYHCRLKGHHSYTFEIGLSDLGAIRRIENALTKLPSLIDEINQNLIINENRLIESQKLLKSKYQEFDRENDLTQKIERLRVLNAELSAG